ncbi:MAG: methyl-accepting chemotaxis protein, partial [Novosphingobium sp.]
SHGDCVGRLARAMAVFIANARTVRESSQERKLIVEELGTAIDALAKGNLSRRIERTFPGELDTLRTSFNAAMAALSDVMNAVAGSANSIDTGAGEIRAASDDLALRTEQQAARLEAASAAMQQVTELVRDNLGSVAEVERSVAHAQNEAERGGAVVEDAVEAMHRIQKSSQEVGQISSVIDGIAFQTNLLALNAGVEVARAGDAGKGFAVVANEVRALAQRSADAAREINQLITTASQEVENGVRLVGDTGRVLGDIVSRVSSVNTLTATIAAAANRQAAMLEEVNDTVRELDRMTQQNAAMVEESTAAARNLAGEAMELSGQVARFGTGTAKRAQGIPPIIAQRAKQPVVRSQGNLALAISEDEDWSDF